MKKKRMNKYENESNMNDMAEEKKKQWMKKKEITQREGKQAKESRNERKKTQIKNKENEFKRTKELGFNE